MDTIYWIILLAAAAWLITAVRVLLSRRDPASLLGWLLVITLLPFIGPLFYLWIGPRRVEKKAFEIEKQKPRSSIDGSKLPSKHPALSLIGKISDYELTNGNKATLLRDPESTLQAMRQAIGEATQFIHLEYYIIASDEVTEQLFDDLISAAKRGVQVRILYDAFGSLFLKKLYFRRLTKAGIQIAGFLPFSFWPKHINPNFRNHRKILIADGKLAFTGGTNIGRKYLGRPFKNQWRDYTVQLSGPVCTQLEDIFARDWQLTTTENISIDDNVKSPNEGNVQIQMIESGPNSPFALLHQSVFMAICSAQKEVLLTTPYFIPDFAIQSALTVASLRGVRVRLLVPAKSDAPIARWASRSYYETLLEAGVEVHEYQPRVLHAKMLVLDNEWLIFGSGNMDTRSFKLNFELNLAGFGKELANQAVELFESEITQSKRIELNEFRARPARHRLIENFCRLFAPIL